MGYLTQLLQLPGLFAAATATLWTAAATRLAWQRLPTSALQSCPANDGRTLTRLAHHTLHQHQNPGTYKWRGTGFVRQSRPTLSIQSTMAKLLRTNLLAATTRQLHNLECFWDNCGGVVNANRA